MSYDDENDPLRRLLRAVPLSPAGFSRDPRRDARAGARRVSDAQLTWSGRPDPDEGAGRRRSRGAPDWEYGAGSPAAGAAGDLFESARLSARRLMEAYLEVFEALAREVAGFSRLEARDAFEEGSGDDRDGPIELEAPPGGTDRDELWLKNESSDELGLVRLWVTPLQSHDGTILKAEALTVAPPAFDDVQPEDNLRILVSAKVPKTTKPGIYHGLVMTSIAGVAKPVVLRVR